MLVKVRKENVTDCSHNALGVKGMATFNMQNKEGLIDNRRGNSCHYENLYLDEESRHQQRYCFVNVEPHTLSIASTALSTPSFCSASNTAVSQMWLSPSSMEQQVLNEVLSVLSSSSTSLSEIIERSRETVLSWLPIIHIPELVWKTNRLQQEPSADVAVLLLAVHLMNELSTPPALQHDKNSAPVLELCRTIFLTLFQKRTASLEAVQAGIILSALQLDAGQLNDASSTIALCANMGIRLSLNNMPVVETGLYSGLDIMKRNIWYAIILLDRYIFRHAFLTSPMLTKNCRLISVANPCSSAAVAVTDESLDRMFAQNLSRDISLPSEYEETYDDFIFQTRAAYMLGKVFSYVRTQFIGCSSCLEAKFWDLDHTLRMMGIAAVKKSCRGGGNLPCIASPLIFRLVFLASTFCTSQLTP